MPSAMMTPFFRDASAGQQRPRPGARQDQPANVKACGIGPFWEALLNVHCGPGMDAT